ncbi:MAG: ATP-binding protein [Methyloversatilis sp.]|uniref:ATP-binding protein n=1 Tax=Methyloversatilis sp. TaxID=2569862 RepID=UPI002735A125|nr:ATP-binding protein [Methyloversatilis sp.]MDP2870031.1 ATP-binding protein [Methyloversatilis sp.]
MSAFFSRLMPRTLFGQILLTLLGGLLVANGIGLWLVVDDRVRLSRQVRSEYAATRVAESIALINDTGPAGRARLVRLLASPSTALSLDEPWHDDARPVDEDFESFASKVGERIAGRHVHQVITLERPKAPAGAPAGDALPLRPPPPPPPALTRLLSRPHAENVSTQARLDDGTVVTFRYSPPPAVAERPLRIIGSLLLVAVVVSLLSIWVVRRLTRPLDMFARAADGLARDLEQAPLGESGPREVAGAARAFNSMQRALRTLIHTRAQALAGVSHDLRLPITRVRLRLEQLPEGPVRDAIERDLADMETLIDDTLAFLRAGDSSEAAAPTRLDALVEGVADDIAALGADIEVSGSVAQPVIVRPSITRRCLANLMDNARRYGGGKIRVTVSGNATEARVDIDDDGPGIPEAERERVFEPYVRLEASRARHTGGSGLGLAIARAVARAQGGDITLSRRPEGGLRASLVLPIAS